MFLWYSSLLTIFYTTNLNYNLAAIVMNYAFVGWTFLFKMQILFSFFHTVRTSVVDNEKASSCYESLQHNRISRSLYHWMYWTQSPSKFLELCLYKEKVPLPSDFFYIINLRKTELRKKNQFVVNFLCAWKIFSAFFIQFSYFWFEARKNWQ